MMLKILDGFVYSGRISKNKVSISSWDSVKFTYIENINQYLKGNVEINS